MQEHADAKSFEYPPDRVHFLELDGRQFILVGTAHVSKESAELARRVIEREQPDRVCVELDRRRYEALAEKRRFECLDLKEVIRKKQLSTLLVNLLLAAYQKKLGMQLGVMPGTELLEAVRAAEGQGIPVSLCDRDIRVTLRRAWRSTAFFKKFLLLSSILASVVEEREITEEQVEELLKADVLSELMKELGEAMPTMKRVLIDERDQYLSHKMREAEGRRIVAVVGAGHLAGIKKALTEKANLDVDSISTVPPASPVWKWIGWGVPAAVVASIVYIGWSRGAAAAGDNVLYWILANGIPSSLGALLALAHPLTVLAAFVAAPITSLTPVIGAAYVTAFVQAYVRPPRVHEFQSVGEDVTSIRRWWQSKLLRIFLAFLLPGIGSMIGSWLGAVEIFSNLVE